MKKPFDFVCYYCKEYILKFRHKIKTDDKQNPIKWIIKQEGDKKTKRFCFELNTY